MASEEGKRSKRKRGGDSDEEESQAEERDSLELFSLWQDMRRKVITQEYRSSLVTRALEIMTSDDADIVEIAGLRHFSSSALQTCVELCTQSERTTVFNKLRPHFVSLACNIFGVRLVKIMLDNATETQLEDVISSLRGHVVSLLRQMLGSGVVEHAFKLANASQKKRLLVELYSTEQGLWDKMISTKEERLVDIIQELGLNKVSVQQQMASVINPILDMGVVDHSILHSALLEYFTIANQKSAVDMMEKMCRHLFRMIHTRAGSKLGILCVKHGSHKVRLGFTSSIKSYVGKMARRRCESMVLACILSMVDTELINKNIIPGLIPKLKKLALHKRGRLSLLQLLNPNYQRYLGPEDSASLSVSVPSLRKNEEDGEDGEDECRKSFRRVDLLVLSGLDESLIKMCIKNARELLRSDFGNKVIYEVAAGGGPDQVLQLGSTIRWNTLHKAIAALAALPKEEQPKEEHVLLNSRSCQTIRKLILNCPSFATTIWKTAFERKCETWVQDDNSKKVLSAFLKSAAQKLAYPELKGFIDSGDLYSSGDEDTP